jgi:hypothetical protein
MTVCWISAADYRQHWHNRGALRFRRDLICDCGNRDDEDIDDPNSPAPLCSDECGRRMEIVRIRQLPSQRPPRSCVGMGKDMWDDE